MNRKFTNYYKSNKKLILFTGVLLLIILLPVYWFGIRVSAIKKDCSERAFKAIGIGEDQTFYPNTHGPKYELAYNICLNQKGQ